MPGLSTNTFWVKCSKPNPQARLRLFCFPHAGKGASLFRGWAEGLPGEVEVCAVQFPGREDRLTEVPFTRMPPLISSLARALYPYLQAKPYAFFGHSMGSLVSFELARYLRKKHYAGPVQLLVAAHRAPQIPWPNPPVHALPDKEFIEELHRLNGTPVEILQNAEMLEIALPMLRADFAVCETYRYVPEDPLACPIFAGGGLDDDETSPDELASWREQTRSTFTLRMFSGNHFFINSNREALLRAITQELLPFLGDC